MFMAAQSVAPVRLQLGSRLEIQGLRHVQSHRVAGELGGRPFLARELVVRQNSSQVLVGIERRSLFGSNSPKISQAKALVRFFALSIVFESGRSMLPARKFNGCVPLGLQPGDTAIVFA